MKFKAHAPRPIPARRKESALAAWWEAAIAAVCTAGAFAIIVAAAENPGSPPVNAAMPPLEAVEPPPSPFDGLPETPAEIERAKAEAEAAFRAAWSPKSVPTTRGTAALSEPSYSKRHGRHHYDDRDGLEYPRDRHHDRKGGHQ